MIGVGGLLIFAGVKNLSAWTIVRDTLSGTKSVDADLVADATDGGKTFSSPHVLGPELSANP